MTSTKLDRDDRRQLILVHQLVPHLQVLPLVVLRRLLGWHRQLVNQPLVWHQLQALCLLLVFALAGQLFDHQR